MVFSNYGTGTQNNNTGSGNQYNAINFLAEKKSSSFLADLRVTDPRDDKIRIEDTKGGLLRDSYNWILENEDFCQWREDTQRRLLWIKGDPGKGKTMLMCGTIDELRQSGEEPILFFCQAADERLNTATSVLRGLLYALFCQWPLLTESFLGKYENAGKQLFEDANAWNILRGMMMTTTLHESLEGVVLVIDALDECTSGLDQLLRVITSLSAQVKVVVSSRNWPSIENGMAAATDQVRVSLELNDQAISAAVDNYICHKVKRLSALKGYDDTMQEDVRAHLTSNSNDTFLWVALVCEQLAELRSSRRHTRIQLMQYPRGLESLYDRILSDILNSPDKDTCIQVLALTSVVHRPLHLTEMTAFLDHKSPLEDIISECNSILTGRGGFVCFVHQSAKDFPLGPAISKVMPFSISRIHDLAFSRSLKIMSRTLRFNMCNLESPGTSVEDAPVDVDDPLKSIRYSCFHWIDHLSDIRPARNEQLGQVLAFMRKHYLHWVEAVGLLQNYSEGVDCISKLLCAIQDSSECAKERPFVQDALRYMRYFRSGIEQSPLQVYAALVFSPKRSIIRTHFRQHEPDWILTKPEVDDEWTVCLQTLEGHSDQITSTTFSPDGLTLVSASLDGAIKLWSTATGQCLQTIKCDRPVITAVCSLDGSMIASALDDGTMRLIDTSTGKEIVTLEDESIRFSKSTVMAISGDGTRVACIRAGSIQLWSTAEPYNSQVLRDYTGWAISIAYSPDGTTIISSHQNGTSRLWNSSTGVCLRVLATSLDTMSPMVFSADGSSVLGFRTSDYSLTEWSVWTGECLSTRKLPLLTRSSHIGSVTMSADGKRIAVVCNNSGQDEVELFNLNTGDHLGVLEGHTGHIESLRISNDGSLLATASYGYTIRLWNIEQLENSKTRLEDTSPMEASQCIACDEFQSGSGFTAKVSSMSPSKPEDTVALEAGVEGHLSFFHGLPKYMADELPIAFSADEKRIVTISNIVANTDISVWDVELGLRVQRLARPRGLLNVLSAYLSDDKFLVFGCSKEVEDEDQVFGVYDLTTTRGVRISKWGRGSEITLPYEFRAGVPKAVQKESCIGGL